MVKKKKSAMGIFILLIGLFILGVNIDTIGVPLGREAAPVFDGEQSNFGLSLVETANKALVDNLFWATVEVTNRESQSGQMFVQCSILDRDAYPGWDLQIQSAQLLNVEENCIADEPFTQTAIVDLLGNEKEEVTFSMRVPDNVAGDNVLYCGTFEQCSSQGDAMVSDEIVTKLTIEDPESGDEVTTPTYDVCATDDDCSQLFWAPQECIDNLCVDKEDKPKKDINVDLSDNAIKAWVEENTILTWLIGLALVIIGMIYSFKEPKSPKRFGGAF